MDAIECAVLGREVDLEAEPSSPLADLRGCPQTPAFHGEGDVAVHTHWVYDLAREHARDLKDQDDAVALRLAALLHDAGKPATTVPAGPGRWTARGHEDEGARLVSELFASHPRLTGLPLRTYPAVHALVQAHMWTYAGDAIRPGAALRLTHLCDPLLLQALWDSDARGRSCDDRADVADRVAYAGMVLAEHDADRAASFGVLDHVADRASVPARPWREAFRALVDGELGFGATALGAASARLAAAERHSTGGSLTYTIGLPGAGKSTWAAEVWAPRTGGVVLSAEGARRRDRRVANAQLLQRIPQELAAGRDILVDATHLVRETRDVLVTAAGRYGADLHAVYVRSALDLSLQRQRTRPGADAIPSATIRQMARRLRWPTPDEYQTLTVVEQDGTSWTA